MRENTTELCVFRLLTASDLAYYFSHSGAGLDRERERERERDWAYETNNVSRSEQSLGVG